MEPVDRLTTKHFDNKPSFECITPNRDELNYETSQISCPHRNEHPVNEKCQKLFKNVMALNVHLQMFHKETGITTASNKYLTRPGRYHCPVKDCVFFCNCLLDDHQILSFSNFNAVRLHFLRQHGLKKEQCSKCLKSFGLHQDFIAHEKICGVNCPFSCTMCEQQFQNRTSLRRHQIKFHSTETQNESQNGKNYSNLNNNTNERQQRRNRQRRRPVPSNQVELARQSTVSTAHQHVTINPMALELLKTFRTDSSSKESTTTVTPDSDKATQTYTRVSVGTECCSLTNSEFHRFRSGFVRSTEQKSSQTQSRIRIHKNQTETSSNRMTSSTNTDDSILVRSNPMTTNVYNASTMTIWENLSPTDIQTEISSSFQTESTNENVVVSNLLENSSENYHSVIIQTLPISMTSTQMQTIAEDLFESTNRSPQSFPLPFQESVGTSCVFDEFLFDEFSRNAEQNPSVLFDEFSRNGEQNSSVLFNFDAMDLLDLIDNGTQTNPLNSSHETQTINEWNSMMLNEDEWIQTMMNN